MNGRLMASCVRNICNNWFSSYSRKCRDVFLRPIVVVVTAARCQLTLGTLTDTWC